MKSLIDIYKTIYYPNLDAFESELFHEHVKINPYLRSMIYRFLIDRTQIIPEIRTSLRHRLDEVL